MKRTWLYIMIIFLFLGGLVGCSSNKKNDSAQIKQNKVEIDSVTNVKKDVIDKFVQEVKSEKENANKEAQDFTEQKNNIKEEKVSPELAKKLGKGVFALFETSEGDFIAKLEYKKVPMTVANFVGLAEGIIPSIVKNGKPFYDGTIFHRVIDGFVIQGGDPTGTGKGGPGYIFMDEFHPKLKHSKAGILSMANAGPATNGSQFFITLAPQPHLDGKHAVFGEIVDGMEVIKKIAKVKTDRYDKPLKDIVIKHLKIIRIGEEAEKFRYGNDPAFENIITIAKYSMEKERRIKEAIIKKEAAMSAKFRKMYPNAKVTESGLMYIIQKEGTGEKPRAGQKVLVHYTGKFPNGKVFDSTLKRGMPFSFKVGAGMVIPAWDETIMDMRKGERRKIIVPPHLAYGDRGAGRIIPPNAWLIFEIQLIDIK